MINRLVRLFIQDCDNVTDPAVREIVDRVQPAYLTHELAAPNRQAKLRAIRQQLDTIERGGERLG